MPLIAYSCSCNHTVKKFVRDARKAHPFLVCDKCGLEMKKMLSAPTSLSKVTVDNGFQAKAVEIIPNIIELNEERSSKDYREKE